MATKPTKENIWNSDNVNDTAPNNAKVALGWIVNDPPPSSYFNWLTKYLFKVAAYVLDGDFTPAGGFLGNSAFRATATAGSGGTGVIAVGGTSGGTGVNGQSTDGAAVRGDSTTGPAVLGISTVGTGGAFQGGSSGDAVVANAGGSYAVNATGGSGGAIAIIATAHPSATNATQIFAQGKGTGAAAQFQGTTTSARALILDGSVDFSGASDVSISTAISNRLTKRLVPKAWGQVATQPDTVLAGANLTSVVSTAGAAGYVTITLAQALTTYSVTAQVSFGPNTPTAYMTYVRYLSTSTFRIYVFDAAGVIVDPTTVANGFVYDFHVMGNV